MNKYLVIWFIFLVRGVLCGNTQSYHAQEENLNVVEAGCVLTRENLSPSVSVETHTRVYYKGKRIPPTSVIHLAADIVMRHKPRDSFYFSDNLFYDRRTYVWFLYGQPITESCTEVLELIQHQLALNGLPYYTRYDLMVADSLRQPQLYPDLDNFKTGLLRVATAPEPTPKLGDVPPVTVVKPPRLQRTATYNE